MKYVLLRTNDGHEDLRLVFCVAPLTHRELAAAFAPRLTAISAGFCAPTPDGKWRTYGQSECFCLAPGADDARLITAHVRALQRESERRRLSRGGNYRRPLRPAIP